MNHRNDAESEASEWQLQERATHEERQGVDAAGSHDELAQYRLIARALGQPLVGSLPQDFVAETVARAEAMTDSNNDRVENWLQRGLFGALLVASVVALALVGRDLEKEVASNPAASWALAVVGCLAVSLTTQLLPGLRPKRG